MVGAKYKLAFKLYPYCKVPEQDMPPVRHPVLIVGGGPVGLALALDLGQKGTPVLVLDDNEGAGQGSRAICFAKRTLEIADRLGAGETMLEKGVVWNVGKVFHKSDKIFEFNLQPEGGHKFPAFVNLQQPYFEKFLVDAVRQAQAAGAPIEIRGRNVVTGIEQYDEFVRVEVTTPDGIYCVDSEYLVACDGARSPTRKMLGLEFEGRVFEDNFLIADVKMKADFPTERWFWFDPPFENSGASALVHKQPDGVWRIDFQLGWEIDRDKELLEENIRDRVDAMLGQGVDYEVVWSSIYTFQCRRMDKFRHGRILFAGDSAHQVSPFGARGANSGVQDADNLAWKLSLVLKRLAPDSLLDSYSEERVHGAKENILNSTRTTDFLTPKSEISQVFRNAVLFLSRKYEFARLMVNSGRLSVPCVYDGLSLNGPDELDGPERTRVGASCVDAPLLRGFLLDHLGNNFTILAINTSAPQISEVDGVAVECLELELASDDPTGAIGERYLGANPCAVYLLRPDQHVAARWSRATADEIYAAVRVAIGKGGQL